METVVARFALVFGGLKTAPGLRQAQLKRLVHGVSKLGSEGKFQAGSSRYLSVYAGAGGRESEEGKWHIPATLFLVESFSTLCPSGTYSEISK